MLMSKLSSSPAVFSASGESEMKISAESGESVGVHTCACVCVFACVNFPSYGSMLLRDKGNYNKMKVTTKRLNRTGVPLQSIHYYPYLQLGIPTPVQCNGGFSLRTADVGKRDPRNNQEGLCLVMSGCCPQGKQSLKHDSSSVCLLDLKTQL